VRALHQVRSVAHDHLSPRRPPSTAATDSRAPSGSAAPADDAFPLRPHSRYATIPFMLPQGWDRRTIVFLAFVLFVLIGPKLAPAQVFDLDRDRVPMAELNGLMRFHTGDDPRWADPNFDDSSWPLIRSDRDWGQQGYQGYSGVAWYRFRVNLPPERRQIAIYVPHLLTSYQVFAQGRLIGQVGQLPPHEKHYGGAARSSFPIPFDPSNPDRHLVIAVRVWQSALMARAFGGGFWGEPPRIGAAETLQDLRSLKMKEQVWRLSATSYQFALELLAGLAALTLFCLRPKEWEYFWFGAYEILNGIAPCIDTYRFFHILPEISFNVAETVLGSAGALCFLGFLFKILGSRNSVIYPIAVSGSLIMMCLSIFDNLGILPSRSAAAIATIWIATSVWQIVLLIEGSLRRSRDAILILVSDGLWTICGAIQVVGTALAEYGHPFLSRHLNLFGPVVDWPFPISTSDICNVIVDISLFTILILRFARSRRDEERMSSELEAARTVQQVLIPEEIPSIPGLALECVYKPAGQVGGDFFQILPTPNNGALIVIGDVSGKGMPAAMAVSLLVGTVRTLAHYTQNPAEILSAMNQRMLGRSKHGFTTCLVLRLDQDGAATISNAGHLAPYQGSKELPVESGLPLGLAAEAEYTESTFHLDPDGELTLVTDGVAEARAKSGELFGFERTASIAILSAQHIAATAQAFGQQDDISVLKIRRQPVPEPTLYPIGA
jgi:hypothetical protein